MRNTRLFVSTSPQYKAAMARILADHQKRYHSAMVLRFWKKFVDSAFWGNSEQKPQKREQTNPRPKNPPGLA